MTTDAMRVKLDGKLFGAQSAAHLNRPLLWIQSDGPQTAGRRR